MMTKADQINKDEDKHYGRCQRGVDKVGLEWALACATQNVLKLYWACTA